MVYVMLGGPATGKGTRSKILSKELKIPHISTGEILREVASTDEGIKEKLSKGELISDAVINELLYNRLSKFDCKNGFVIDGYPRIIGQVYALDDILERLDQKITKVVELIIPEELVYKRILNRRECTNCDKVYGVDFLPKNEGYCDICGKKLVLRQDDTEEIVRKRLETYKEMANPILEYYEKKGFLIKVESSNNPDGILDQINK